MLNLSILCERYNSSFSNGGCCGEACSGSALIVLKNSIYSQRILYVSLVTILTFLVVLLALATSPKRIGMQMTGKTSSTAVAYCHTLQEDRPLLRPRSSAMNPDSSSLRLLSSWFIFYSIKGTTVCQILKS